MTVLGAMDPASTESSVPSVRVELPIDAVSVSIARSIVRRNVIFRDDEMESSFLVALNEITANAIAEHQRIGTSAPVILMAVGGVRPSISVTDRGGGLDVSLLDPVEASVVPVSTESGRGLTIARVFVPDLEFDVTTRGTTARLPLDQHGILV